jgi:hypothetical protein
MAQWLFSGAGQQQAKINGRPGHTREGRERGEGGDRNREEKDDRGRNEECDEVREEKY